ncbi:gamma-glutamyl-gamma-aminobutyrate hydrolase [Ralstonia pickettii]|uniref:gamma-glutamyl-gamma-aminobutyrate hydrolase family protein n=1 Tax=Ralstonia pickettii TaxID=329 RepID=UPI000CD50E79|nr:gamma-glutamyl-gamma-aminobutyrate hydrolase [Ralstonia pickettii]
MTAAPAGRPPVIGLTTYLERIQQDIWDLRAPYLPATYLDAVTTHGGVGVLLPPQPVTDAAVEATLDGIDALVITGGLDVDPARYGQAPHPTTDRPREDRDAWELALLAGARRRGIPVFGICRGLQLINVAFGGTLHQHLPDVLGDSRYQIGGGVFARGEATVEPGTRLADALGAGGTSILSYHHQGIDRVGDGLVVSARSADGLVQGIETAGEDYLVAVQWHPEQDPSDPRLFAAVIAQAAARAARLR